MKRIYSNYSDEDYELIKSMTKELGFSLSSFQHYCVMLYADSRGNTTLSSNLISEMVRNLDKINTGDTFIVSALLPDVWPSLTRNVKMTLAKQLAIHVRNDPKFEPYKVAKGKTTVYKKIG
jgi:translation elongation factor EF-1beta